MPSRNICGCSVPVDGIDLDVPIPSELRKCDFKVYKEGSRTTIKELWLDRTFKEENGAWVTWSYCLKMTNYGKCSLDEKVLHGKDAEVVKEIFESLKEVLK